MPGQTEQPLGTALVVGATGDIGRAIARRLGRDGWKLQLAGRDGQRLEAEAQDLRLRGVSVEIHRCDVQNENAGVSLLDALSATPDIAVCTVGMLGDQSAASENLATAEVIMRTNYTGPALLMGELANRFEQRGSGVLVGISSIAGDRGRRTNYTYGSAKSGFTTFLAGLRNRLWRSGVHVITVKPGYVRTR
ncbi:MAG: SDR family NAD(P)-dependent oxidoreductase, partial [Gammaproteobacteria bacterium]|nr:SDR family NAD(P)-dependent oxidoreductase [Gammaproteobacteria bacterium]